MKRVVAGLLAAIFAASVGGVAIAQTNSAADAELATNIGSRVKDVTGVGIVAGTIVFGSSNTIVAGSTGGSASLDADTVFEIGSITKTFTATVLADMVRRGEVALDDPIEKYLPAGSTGPTFNGAHVTLLDLATQSSGLPRMPTNFAPANRDNPYVDYAQPQLYGFLGSYQLTRAPGSKYEYSNVGFGLLGQLLANRVKTTYEALVQARLLAILAMTSTGITLSPAMREHLAPGRDVDGNPAGNWDLGALAGAGAIRSSMRDMLKYLAANMNGSGPIGEDAKMAQTPRRPAQGAGQIGLAWPIAKSGVVWHNGQTGGYHAFIGFSADRTRGIVLMTNAATTIDDIGIHWLDPSVPLVKTYAALALDPKLLAKYVGSYMITIGPNSVPFVVSLQNGRLYTKLGQQPALAIYPYGQNAFFLRVMDAQIDFTADASGAITGFVLHQNGQNVTGTRTGS